jgi:hypothetical protein
MRIERPWAAFEHEAFAGPRTVPPVLRGTRLDVDAEAAPTYEVVEAAGVPAERVPPDAVRAGEALFVPSAAGATLGEIVDESERQNAQLDQAFGLAMVAPIFVPEVLQPPDGIQPAISIDHVLVGFDGSVRFRGRLPWWGERAAPALGEAGGEESLLLVLAVLGSVLMSKRVGAMEAAPAFGNMFAGVGSRAARELLTRTIGPEAAGLWDRFRGGLGGLGGALVPVLALVDMLGGSGGQSGGLLGGMLRGGTGGRGASATPPPSTEAIGAFVRNVFPQRWADEQRVPERIDAMRGALR